MVLALGKRGSSVLATKAPAVGGGGGNAVELIRDWYNYLFIRVYEFTWVSREEIKNIYGIKDRRGMVK